MVHLGFCNVHKVASEPESRLVWNVLDACLRSREMNTRRKDMPSCPLTNVGLDIWQVVKGTRGSVTPFVPSLCFHARCASLRRPLEGSRETYGKCLSIQLCQMSDKCGQVFILLAMRLHPSCSGDDTPSVMSISHSQTTIQSPGRLDPPPSTLDMESPALQATSVPPPNLHIYACWRCNRTDMKSSGTMVDTPG